MRRAPADAAFSISSTPRSSVFRRSSVTGGCWMTATLCVPARLDIRHRVVARTRQHPGEVLAELTAQPARSRDKCVEVDAGFNTLPAKQVDQVLGRDVACRVRREGTPSRAADGRVQRHDTLLQRGDRVRVAGVASVVEVGADGRAQFPRAAYQLMDLRGDTNAD